MGEQAQVLHASQPFVHELSSHRHSHAVSEGGGKAKVREMHLWALSPLEGTRR